MKINWIMVFGNLCCYAAGYGMTCIVNRLNCRRRNRSLAPSAFRIHMAELCYYLGECGAKAGYAAAITCGVLLGIGCGLPLLVALTKIMHGGQ